MATTKRTTRLRPKNLARVQNMLMVLAEAKANGKELTRMELFNILVEQKKEKDGPLHLNMFGGLIRDAIRLGHVGLKEIKDTKPPGRKWEAWEDKVVIEKTHEEARTLLPHRPSVNISSRRYMLNNIIPTRQKVKSARTAFTEQEKQDLRDHYPTMQNSELQKKYFSNRSIDTLVATASRLGLRKTKLIVPTMDPDKKIIEDILYLANARGITAQQLDKIVNAKGYFQWNWKNEHRRLHLEVIERAARFLGMRLRLDPLPAAPNFRQMLREWKIMACAITDEPKDGERRQQARAKPLRPTNKTQGNHRAKEEIQVMVENLVPRQHPLRADVIQEVLLAYYEGEFTMDDLKTKEGLRTIRDMANASHRKNYELGGFARSMDAPLGDGTSTLHDLIAAE